MKHEVSLFMSKEPRVRDPIIVRRCERSFPTVEVSLLDGGAPFLVDDYTVDVVIGDEVLIPDSVDENIVIFTMKKLPSSTAFHIAIEGTDSRITTEDYPIEVIP